MAGEPLSYGYPITVLLLSYYIRITLAWDGDEKKKRRCRWATPLVVFDRYAMNRCLYYGLQLATCNVILLTIADDDNATILDGLHNSVAVVGIDALD